METEAKTETKETSVKEVEVDLGKCGSLKLQLSENQQRLLIEFDTFSEGLDKAAVSNFIDALEKIRRKMDR